MIFRDGFLEFGTLVLSVGMYFCVVDTVFAHEPAFSLGPETIFKEGWGLEIEFEFDEEAENRNTSLHYEIIYGLTENMSLTLQIPLWLHKQEGGREANGLGDIGLRMKYQLYRKDTLGAQDKVALIYGVEFPSGDEDRDPALGNGAVDHLFGLTLGHESIRWYGFITGRYVLRPESGSLNKGDRILFDYAFGFRPWIRPYRSWDLVVLVENSYLWTGKDERDAVKSDNSGGQELFIGPTFLWSIRNLMVKAGVQFLVWDDLNGRQESTDFLTLWALEYHF